MSWTRRPASWLPAYVAGIGLTAAAMLVLAEHRHGTPRVLATPWWVLALAFVAIEMSPLYFQFRGETQSFGLDEIALVIALFTLSPLGLLVAMVTACTLVLGVWRRIPLVKLAFNVSQIALSTMTAVCVFRLLSPGDPLAVRSWFAALAAAATFVIIGALTVAGAIRLAEGRVPVGRLRDGALFACAGALVNTMLGLIAIIMMSESLLAASLLIGPIVVVFVAYRAYVSERSKRHALEFLYRASELLRNARDLETGLVALLEFARDTFHAEVAEVTLTGDTEDGDGFRTYSGPGEARARLEPVSRAHVDAVLAVVADTSGDPLTLTPPPAPLDERDGVRIASMMIAPLYGESELRGAVFCTRSPDAIVETFDKEELQLFDTFANQLGITLERSRLSSSLAQLRVVKQELAHQAHHDALTGLANRVLFRERVDAALFTASRTGESVAVLFIDLDDFKTVNDTFGHAAGDSLLAHVANRLQESIREGDTPARLGGDEFAVLLPNATNDTVVRMVADRILSALAEPVNIEGQAVMAKASIGIAREDGSTTASELMQQADVAMYTAKRNGKGRFDKFDPSMRLSVSRRQQMKMHLARAVANDELEVIFDPVVDTTRRDVTGAAARLIWNDPATGAREWHEFGNLAEETGLAVPMGRVVLQAACREATARPDIGVFVHLSARELADEDLIASVRCTLEETSAAAEHIIFAVDESTIMHDIERARTALHELKALGVRLAVDDFGTGVSSLGYLRTLPVDIVKISKSIVDGTTQSDVDASFLRAVIELGHVIGLQVGASGVDGEEQHEMLVEMGCDFVEGEIARRYTRRPRKAAS